jgi:hypothetical protein
MGNPFLDLVVEALNLTHPRFAGSDRASFVREFYHQFRKLWDKALPVRLGLGHVLVRPDPDLSPHPDLVFWRLGEGGEPDRRLGAVSVAFGADAGEAVGALTAAAAAGYPQAVLVAVGAGRPAAPGVTTLAFDPARWRVVSPV